MNKKHEFIDAEKQQFAIGSRFVIGVDEAGRGAFAGPLTFGFCSFKPSFFNKPLPESLQGLNDSKQITPARRQKYYPEVKKYADFWGVVHVSSQTIDAQGLSRATLMAVETGLGRAFRFSRYKPFLLVDGNYRFPELRAGKREAGYRSIIKGDSLVFSIAAASILAKVSRDNRMVRWARYFPGYDLEKHKGYGTKVHRASILAKGPSILHRRSYLNNLLGEEKKETPQSLLDL